MGWFAKVLRLVGRSQEPAVSQAGEATVYYDPAANAIKASKNGGGYTEIAVGGVPPDGSVTNDSLSADVKVGSLALLNTPAVSVTDAIDAVEVKADQGIADAAAAQATAAAAYVQPVGGIPEADLDAATQAKLAANANAVQGQAAGQDLVMATVGLGGANPTRVNFQGADIAATILGTADEPFALDDGLTLVVNPDAGGDDTVTFAAAAGTSVSAAAPAETMVGEVDNKLRIAVDGGLPTLVTFDWTAGGGCDTGVKIAAEMQTKIQALAPEFASVTVAFGAGVYTITSGTKGTGSAVVITAGDDHNCTEELKLGVDNGGTENAGTGDAANIAAATAAEVAAAITARATGWSGAAEGTKVRITSATQGPASSLVVNAGSTADLILGFAGSDYGEAGLGLAADMADANYRVSATRSDAAAAPGDTIAVGGKATDHFDLYCETAGSTDEYDLLILGTLA